MTERAGPGRRTWLEVPGEIREAFAVELLTQAQRYHWTKPGQRGYWRTHSRAIAAALMESDAFAAVLDALTEGTDA
jgi:hypothetical protein